MNRILIVTDAWHPQINGVVCTLEKLDMELTARGYQVDILSPEGFLTIPMPTYPEIRLSMTVWGVSSQIDQINPDYLHIATEGPLGLLARLYCTRHQRQFTTSYHTRFPEYIKARFPFPKEWSYGFLRWMHAPSQAVLVPTPSVRRDLQAEGFERLKLWTRGVDTDLFHPKKSKRGQKDDPYRIFKGPIYLYVGRIAVEKNVEAFLQTDISGTKVLVGDGPQLSELKNKYPQAQFLGFQKGEALSELYASADIFVFPSKTDTFGNVMLEAMASGLPVAAYPVAGPIDVIKDMSAGILDHDLSVACQKALALKKQDARAYATGFSWCACADIFEHNLAPCQPLNQQNAA